MRADDGHETYACGAWYDAGHSGSAKQGSSCTHLRCMDVPIEYVRVVMNTLRIAFLHLAPTVGEVAANQQLVTAAVTQAAAYAADWVLTPELCICGYQFANTLGTAWIASQPDAWMTDFCTLVAHLGVTVFLSHPDRDAVTDTLYNTLFVIGPDGAILGKHHKISIIPGAESWAARGAQLAPITVPPLHVGLLICADAYPPPLAAQLHAEGAQVFVSAAAWAPGLYGPDGEWEQRSSETGLPMLVCNRTGMDRTLDFRAAESVVVVNGERRLTFCAPHSAIFLVAWHLDTQEFVFLDEHIVNL